MTLGTLRLIDFRNFRDLEVDFAGRSAAVWGPNGRGKSNLLEAIVLLGTTRSHRTRRDAELVRFGARGFFVSGEFSGGERRSTLAVSYSDEEGKRGIVDRKETARLADLVGRCGVVCVSPEDVEITSGEPEERRRYLDLTLCSLSPVYLRSLQEYNRAHRHRGRLLREAGGRSTGSHLETWEVQLARWAVPVFSMRREAVRELGPLAEEVYGALGGTEELTVSYAPGVGEEETISEEKILTKLREKRALDLQTGRTSIGPHRDDVEIRLDGRSIRSFGSRGQHRSAVLALKLAAARLMERRMGEAPLLLLDDVFTELDESRSDALAGQLGGEGQTFATGTDGEALRRFLPAARGFALEEGGALVHAG